MEPTMSLPKVEDTRSGWTASGARSRRSSTCQSRGARQAQEEDPE